jgi:2OG-Fe(II) oxygenase superfamily
MHAYQEPRTSLDTPYTVNPRLVSSIKSADSMMIFGSGPSIELPIAFFQVLMAFAEPTTVREAFQALNVDVPIDEFSSIVDNLVERGLLKREPVSDHERGLREILEPRIGADAASVERIGAWMRQGRAIIIMDALPGDFAEEVHRDLCRSTQWTVMEGYHDFFHYRNSAINQLEGQSSTLAECSRLFKSAATRRFIADLSGQDCSGQASAGAAWYRPSEYALPHDDSAASDPRSVAYIWYLTKDWKHDWGGALFWCPTGQYISPRFNMLVMFRVTPSNVHFICPVAPTATGRRLTINGFWNRAQRDASVSSPALAIEEFVSARVYGPPAPESLGTAAVLVL